MVDKIKPLKIEEKPDGTAQDLFPTEADPSEDYASIKGIALENNDSRTLDLDGSGYLQGTDARGWSYPVGEDFTALLHEPSGFPNRTDSTMSFTDGTLTFSITPAVSSFDYYFDGKKYTISSADTVQITDTEGIWFIYYNGATLTAAQAPWDFSLHVPVAIVYWDATNNEAILFGEERHGLTMDWATHARLHQADGTQLIRRESSFMLGDYVIRGDGSSNSHAQFSLTDGTIYDEDIEIDIVNSASPSDLFEQKLSTVAYLPLYYKEGGGDWRKITATEYAIVTDSGNTIKYNYYNSSTEQYSLVNAAENSYVITWVVATNSLSEPVIGIISTLNSSNLSQCVSERWDEVSIGIPSKEYVPLHKLIFRTSTSYTNTPKVVLYDERDLRVPVETQDRYTFVASYNGNANVGRYLEVFNGVGSDVIPYYFPEDSFIRTMTLNSTQNDTGTVSIYRTSDLSTAVMSISIDNETYAKSTDTEFFENDESIVLKVSSGSISKPSVRIWIQTSIELES